MKKLIYAAVFAVLLAPTVASAKKQVIVCADDHVGITIESDGTEDARTLAPTEVKASLTLLDKEFEGFAGHSASDYTLSASRVTKSFVFVNFYANGGYQSVALSIDNHKEGTRERRESASVAYRVSPEKPMLKGPGSCTVMSDADVATALKNRAELDAL